MRVANIQLDANAFNILLRYQSVFIWDLLLLAFGCGLLFSFFVLKISKNSLKKWKQKLKIENSVRKNPLNFLFGQKKNANSTNLNPTRVYFRCGFLANQSVLIQFNLVYFHISIWFFILEIFFNENWLNWTESINSISLFTPQKIQHYIIWPTD